MIKSAFAFAAIVLAACSPPAEREPQAPAAEASVTTPAAPAPKTPPEAAPPEQASDDWRVYAQASHVAAISSVGETFKDAIAKARAAGHGEEIDGLGALLKADAGLDRPIPSPGAYRCRSIQYDGRDPVFFFAYPYFRCEVELTPGGDLIARKLTGSQRFQGKLYPDGEKRLIFLGAAAWGMDEKGYPAYGAMPERDQFGPVERIGPNRYRIVILNDLPTRIEVIELIR